MKNKWFLLIILWQVIGLAITFILSVPVINYHGFIYRMMFSLSIVNSVALICSVIFLTFDRKINSLIKSNWIYLLIVVVTIAAGYYFSSVIVPPIVNSVCNVNIRHDVDKNHIYVIVINFIILIVIIASYMMIYFYFKLKKDWEKKVYEIEAMKRLQLETKLTLLQSKVNPHFLFNTLNTTLNLVYKMPEKVENIILNLSDIYRSLLNLPENEPITLEDEIKLISRYLEIEKIRLNDRLTYNIKCDKSAFSYMIPPLILQTLIENAVLHGIAPKKEGGIINLDIAPKDSMLIVTVSDSGIGYMPDSERKGFGIYSVKERLKLFYKGKADFKIAGSKENGTTITISLPYDKD